MAPKASRVDGTHAAGVARREAHRRHYDAISVSPPPFAGGLGAAAYPPELRAPYRYAENILMRDCVGGKRVLDYGCGDGPHALRLALDGAMVTGVDISPRMVALARSRAAALGLCGRAEFFVGDAERLPFPDQAFDIVFESGTLSCLDRRVAYAEIARVLRPDGLAVFVETLGHNPLLNASRRRKFRRGLKTEWSVAHILRLPDIDEAKGLFERVDVRFFDLCTLPLAVARRFAPDLTEWLAPSAMQVDATILRSGPLQRLSFKVVVTLTGPRAPAERGALGAE